jgi:hypothetical protein
MEAVYVIGLLWQGGGLPAFLRVVEKEDCAVKEVVRAALLLGKRDFVQELAAALGDQVRSEISDLELAEDDAIALAASRFLEDEVRTREGVAE